MLISCPCCDRKISVTARICPYCGCDVQQEIEENWKVGVALAKWCFVPLIIVCLFMKICENDAVSFVIWLISQIGWAYFLISLKNRSMSAQTSDDEDEESQVSSDEPDTDDLTLRNTDDSTSESTGNTSGRRRNIVERDNNESPKTNVGRKLEL